MKKLVVFSGPPCTGKSSVARELGWAHLEMDEARQALLPRAAHTRADREVAYRAVLWAAEHLLRFTDIVICDGGYGHPEDRTACAALAKRAGARLYRVVFFGPLELLLERNRARRSHHPGLDLTDERVTELVETSQPWGDSLRIDSAQPLPHCVETVRAYLQTAGA